MTALCSRLLLERSHEDRVLTIRINHPQKRNAISRQMFLDLLHIMDEASRDERIVVIVLTGSGSYFSSGNDLTNFTEALEAPNATMSNVASEGAQLVQDVVEAFIACSKVLVAKVNGNAIGIMVTLLGLFDLVYAIDTAQFLTPFVPLGQSPEGCSSLLFPTLLGRGVALEMFALKRELSADVAKSKGLVTETYSTAAFEAQVTQKIDQLANLPPQSLLATKRLISSTLAQDLRATNLRETAELEQRFQSEECFEAILKFFTPKAKM